jgi:hypothetical protein
MQYLNKDITLVLDGEIVEYDIQSGNTSIIREFNLLPDGEVSRLEKLKKEQRVIQVGLISKKDKVFSKALEKGFTSVVTEFIKVNELSKTDDIISVKKDAVFVVNTPIKHNKIGNHVKFIMKNVYTDYLYLPPYEFYFGENELDVKGITDKLLDSHMDGMLNFVLQGIQLAKTPANNSRLNTFLHNFVELYKKRKLPIEYYREFNSMSKYKYDVDGTTIYLDSIDKKELVNVDISYNYMTIVLPFIKTVI